MGWRDTQRQVESGELNFRPEAPSDFQQGIGMLLKTGANYIQDQEDRRREEAMKFAEEQKAKNEEINRKRKEKNALERKRRAKSLTILKNLGYDPRNTNHQRHVIGTLTLFDDDAEKTLEYYTELGSRLKDVAPHNLKNPMTSPRGSGVNQQTDAMLNPNSFTDRLSQSESGGRVNVVTTDVKGRKVGGEFQLGKLRLQDYNELYGTNFTPESFAQLSKEEQRRINNWHFKDISTFIRNEGLDEYVGEEINGTVLTEASLVAIAHLGGKTGLRRYLTSGGRTNPHDEVRNPDGTIAKTYLSDYAEKFADSSLMMEDETDDPNFSSFVISKSKELFDPFKKKDGSYRSLQEVQFLVNDPRTPSDVKALGKMLLEPNRDPVTMSPENLKSYIGLRKASGQTAGLEPYEQALSDKLKFREEEAKSAAPLKTAKQMALAAAIQADNVTDMTAAEQFTYLTQWEQTWNTETAKVKEKSTTYSKANYIQELIENNELLLSENPADRKKAIDFFTIRKPIIEASLSTIANFDQTAQIKALVDSGVDETTARGVVFGTIKNIRNTRGENLQVDNLTGEAKKIGPQAAAPETMEQAILEGFQIDPSQFDVDWKNKPITMTVGEYTDSEGNVVPSQAITITPEMIQEYQNSKGAPEDIGYIKGAFGLSGKIAEGLGKVGGAIGFDWFPKTNDAISYLENLRLNTLITLAGTAANGLRDSVWNKQQILTTLAEPARVWKGAPSQYRKLNLTLKEINAGIAVSKAQASSQQSNPVTISKAQVTLQGLEKLKTKYENVLSLFDQSVAAEQPITDTVLKQPSDRVTIYDQAGYDALPMGAKYIFKGKNYTKGKTDD
jgi:hypothetical protein